VTRLEGEKRRRRGDFPFLSGMLRRKGKEGEEEDEEGIREARPLLSPIPSSLPGSFQEREEKKKGRGFKALASS